MNKKTEYINKFVYREIDIEWIVHIMFTTFYYCGHKRVFQRDLTTFLELESKVAINYVAYSQVPIKQVGPIKRVGWLFWVNFIKECCQINEWGGKFANRLGWKRKK